VKLAILAHFTMPWPWPWIRSPRSGHRAYSPISTYKPYFAKIGKVFCGCAGGHWDRLY